MTTVTTTTTMKQHRNYPAIYPPTVYVSIWTFLQTAANQLCNSGPSKYQIIISKWPKSDF